MRIGMTVEAAHGPEDLLVECDDSTTVEQLEQSLHEHLGRRVRLPGRGRDPACSALVNGARLGGAGRRRARQRTRWQLHVVSGPDSGVVWDLAPGDHVIGRSGGICWDDPALSRRHLSLSVRSAVEVTDLGSRHGTSIEGHRCVPGEALVWPLGGMLEAGTSV
ncbi:MAG: FHA domain-containing protein, partial [Marmoricola sp.]